MTAMLSYEIDDLEYVIEAEGFTLPTMGSRDEPPDGGEVYPYDKVKILRAGKTVGHVTFAEFLLAYAASLGCLPGDIEQDVIDDLYDAARESYENAFDDGDSE